MAYLVLTINDEQLETVWTQVKNINGVDDINTVVNKT